MAETIRQPRPIIQLNPEQHHRRHTHFVASFASFVDLVTMKLATATAFAAFFATASAFSVQQQRCVIWPFIVMLAISS